LEFPYEEKSIETFHNYEVSQGTFVGSFVQIVQNVHESPWWLEGKWKSPFYLFASITLKGKRRLLSQQGSLKLRKLLKLLATKCKSLSTLKNANLVRF
jgi:hypothetical protein